MADKSSQTEWSPWHSHCNTILGLRESILNSSCYYWFGKGHSSVKRPWIKVWVHQWKGQPHGDFLKFMEVCVEDFRLGTMRGVFYYWTKVQGERVGDEFVQASDWQHHCCITITWSEETTHRRNLFVFKLAHDFQSQAFVECFQAAGWGNRTSLRRKRNLLQQWLRFPLPLFHYRVMQSHY